MPPLFSRETDEAQNFRVPNKKGRFKNSEQNLGRSGAPLLPIFCLSLHFIAHSSSSVLDITGLRIRATPEDSEHTLKSKANVKLILCGGAGLCHYQFFWPVPIMSKGHNKFFLNFMALIYPRCLLSVWGSPCLFETLGTPDQRFRL